VVDDASGEACPGKQAAQQVWVATRTDGADLGGGDQLLAAELFSLHEEFRRQLLNEKAGRENQGRASGSEPTT
jgi:hypothetical protein